MEFGKRFGVAVTSTAHARLRRAVQETKLPVNYLLSVLLEHWDEVVDKEKLAPHAAQARATKPKRKVSAENAKSLINRLDPGERKQLIMELAREAD